MLKLGINLDYGSHDDEHKSPKRSSESGIVSPLNRFRDLSSSNSSLYVPTSESTMSSSVSSSSFSAKGGAQGSVHLHLSPMPSSSTLTSSDRLNKSHQYNTEMAVMNASKLGNDGYMLEQQQRMQEQLMQQQNMMMMMMMMQQQQRQQQPGTQFGAAGQIVGSGPSMDSASALLAAAATRGLSTTKENEDDDELDMDLA